MVSGYRSYFGFVGFSLLLCSLAAESGIAEPIQQAAAPATPQAKTDPRVGKKVIVTEDRAPLRTPKEIVWKAYRGEVFTISIANGEWLWIASKGGWLWDQQVVLFDDAIQLLTDRLTKEPTAENFDLRGIGYTAHDQFDNAAADFTESLKLKPEVPGVLNNRGRALYLKGDYAAAAQDFDAAIRINPQHFVAMLNRANCFVANDNLDAALNDLNAAIKLNPEFSEALNNRGVIYSKKADYENAIRDFSTAIRIDSNYIDAYGNRAAAYRWVNKFAEAISDLKIAQEKDPTNYKSFNDLAWIYATALEPSVRQPKEAVTIATKACEMTQYEDWNALDTLAAAYAAHSDFKLAQQWILTAIEKAPEAEKERLTEHQKLLMDEKLILK